MGASAARAHRQYRRRGLRPRLRAQAFLRENASWIPLDEERCSSYIGDTDIERKAEIRPRKRTQFFTRCFSKGSWYSWGHLASRLRGSRCMMPGLLGGSEMKRSLAGAAVAVCALSLSLIAAAPAARKAAPGLTPERVHFTFEGLARSVHGEPRPAPPLPPEPEPDFGAEPANVRFRFDA